VSGEQGEGLIFVPGDYVTPYWVIGDDVDGE
jgi:hypothetical protein